MTRQTKLTQDLHWATLVENFPIGYVPVTKIVTVRDEQGKALLDGNGAELTAVITTTDTVFVNKMQEAIDAGVIDQLITECAKQYHNGDFLSALNWWKRVMDSQRHNISGSAYRPTLASDMARLETIDKYTTAKRAMMDKSGRPMKSAKPQWAYGPDEIDQITDAAVLQKVINSIADVCSGAKANVDYATRLGPDFMTVAKANRAYARTRMAALKKELSSDQAKLINVLQDKQGKITLTAAQAAELRSLLAKLQK